MTVKSHFNRRHVLVHVAVFVVVELLIAGIKLVLGLPPL
jgi:hypothetical protein